MGSITVPAATVVARRSAATATAALMRHAPIARLHLARQRRLRDVQDVTGTEPERTRRLPLHELAEREGHALGLAPRPLTQPDELVLGELGPAAGEGRASSERAPR